MNKNAKLIKSCASLCVAAAVLLLPVKAWAIDLDLGNGAITFGGDSAAGVTTYAQGGGAAVAYTDTANVTGDYAGSDTAVTVNGGNHTIVLDGVSLTPGSADSAAPAISITGGEQDITLTDTYINAGEVGPGLVIDGGEHTLTMDDFAVNGGGAGIAIAGGADVDIHVQSDSFAVMGDAPAMSVTEDSAVTVTGGAVLTLSSESAGGALTGDGTGSLSVPAASKATVKAQTRGAQASAQGVELEGRVRTTSETIDNVLQTVTTITRERDEGFQVRIEYLGDGRFQINVREAPIRVELDGVEVEFTFADGVITVLNMPAGVTSMAVTWAAFRVGISFPQPLY